LSSQGEGSSLNRHTRSPGSSSRYVCNTPRHSHRP